MPKRKTYIDRDEYTKSKSSNTIPRTTYYRNAAAHKTSSVQEEEDPILSAPSTSGHSGYIESQTDSDSDDDYHETESESTSEEEVDTHDIGLDAIDPQIITDNPLPGTTPTFLNPDLTSDEKLHQYTDTTLGEAFLLLLSFMLRHNLSFSAMDDLLSLLQVLLPAHNLLPETKYLFRKVCNSHELTNVSQEHFYCEICEQVIIDVNDDMKQCPNCNADFNKKENKKNGKFFMYFPLESQLRNLFQSDGVWDLISKCREASTNSSLGNVCKGSLYQNSSLANTQTNVSITWNCDGVKIFKSSSFSIWPIFCTVNELPVLERKRNAMLVSLWFGEKKPNMHGNYLRPFVEEVQKLQNTGFEWTHPKTRVPCMSKVACLICVCDAPAKAMVQNMTMFNGECGCPYCIHSGDVVPCGNGTSRVYKVKHPKPALRDQKSVQEAAVQTLSQNDPVLGIKGPSELLLLAPTFDVVKSFSVDYMHAVCLGVVRTFLTAWLEDTGKAYYLTPNLVQQLNARFERIHPPCDITRMLRNTKDKKSWKANEYRQFLLLSPVLLADILPRKYCDHWTLLASSIFCLMEDDISLYDLEKCESMLEEFVSQIEVLYDETYCTFNVHTLSHLTQSVRNTGSMTSCSAFVFEDLNGQVKKLVKGTKGIHLQISEKFMLIRVIRYLLELHCQKNSHFKSFQLLNHLVNRYPIVKKQTRCGMLTFMGNGYFNKLTLHHKFLLSEFIGSNNISDHATYFKKVLISNQVFKCSGAMKRGNGKRGRRDDIHIRVNNVFAEICEIMTLNYIDSEDKSERSTFLICKEIRVTHCARFGMIFSFGTEFGNTFVVNALTKGLRKCFFIDLPNIHCFSNYMCALLPLPRELSND